MYKLSCSCGTKFSSSDIRFFCDCNELLEIQYSDNYRESLPGCVLFDERTAAAKPGMGSGVWRYRELVLPGVRDDEIVSLGEGNTPLLTLDSVTKWAGSESLQLKHEGYNPTGSFKDRGMTVALTKAKQQNAGVVACASTGNTSASMAAYASSAGIPAVILIPEGKISLNKLSQALAFGATTVEISGDFDAGMQLIMEAARDGKLYPMNSVNPYRVEGQKTIIWEILQQLSWDTPDWIIFPAGNLGNYSAFGRALEQVYRLGYIKKKPRLAGVQAEGASPFYKAYKNDFTHLEPEQAETVATAIRIGNPVNYPRAVRSVKFTNGIVASVTDQEIMDAKAVVDRSGVGAEPASCASVAGVRKLIAEGVIKPTDKVVGILTGHILKDTDAVIGFHSGTLTGITSATKNKTIKLSPTKKALYELIDSMSL